MKLKRPPQPLVFRFDRIGPLCGAVSLLYGLDPGMRAELSLYRGRYYLAVHAALGQRRSVAAAAGDGRYLGPAVVAYAWCAEHGRELTRNALRDLRALFPQDPGG